MLSSWLFPKPHYVHPTEMKDAESEEKSPSPLHCKWGQFRGRTRHPVSLGPLRTPQPAAPRSAPQIREERAPGFQTHSVLDRQTLQPIRGRKASTLRSLYFISQSTSRKRYIPPSEERAPPSVGGHLECGRVAAPSQGAFFRFFILFFAPSVPGSVESRHRGTRGAFVGSGAAPEERWSRVITPRRAPGAILSVAKLPHSVRRCTPLSRAGRLSGGEGG